MCGVHVSTTVVGANYVKFTQIRRQTLNMHDTIVCFIQLFSTIISLLSTFVLLTSTFKSVRKVAQHHQRDNRCVQHCPSRDLMDGYCQGRVNIGLGLGLVFSYACARMHVSSKASQCRVWVCLRVMPAFVCCVLLSAQQLGVRCAL